MTPDEARELVAAIRVSVDDVRDKLVALYTGQGWLALGYADWATLCEVEFDSTAVSRLLPREQRLELVAGLTESGLTQRAIGDALRVDRRQVRRDQVGTLVPTSVFGIDGKEYSRERIRESQRAAADHAARLRADDEIERGIRDTNLHTAEHVHALAGGVGAAEHFLTRFYPRHAELVIEPMRLTRVRVTAARDFLDTLLSEGDLP